MRRNLAFLGLFIVAYLALIANSSLAQVATEFAFDVIPSQFKTICQIKDNGPSGYVVKLSVPDEVLDTTKILEFGCPATYVYPRLMLRANALTSGKANFSVYPFDGELSDANYNKLVHDKRVQKFEFDADELYEYLGLSAFEVARRTVKLNGPSSIPDPKTAQILYQHLNAWIVVADRKDYRFLPSDEHVSDVTRLLTRFANWPQYSDQWYAAATGNSRQQFKDAIARVRGLRANYFQRVYDGILAMPTCIDQSAMFGRMLKSFEAMNDDEQRMIAAEVNAAKGTKGRFPSEWRKMIEATIADRKDRQINGVACKI